jgi:hypothetical protein
MKKSLSLVKGNLVEVLVIGFVIGFISLVIYNCITIGTTCYFSV